MVIPPCLKTYFATANSSAKHLSGNHDMYRASASKNSLPIKQYSLMFLVDIKKSKYVYTAGMMLSPKIALHLRTLTLKFTLGESPASMHALPIKLLSYLKHNVLATLI